MWWTLLAATVAAGTALYIALHVYPRQKEVDRREALIRSRQTAYTDFLLALFDHAEHRNDESRFAYDRAKVQLGLVASDAVLSELVMVQEAATMDMDALGPGDVHERVISLIAVMRKDCFEETKASLDDLAYITPIGKPTPLAATPEGHFEPTDPNWRRPPA